MSGITRLSATRLNRSFLAGELSAVEIVEAHLERISTLDPQIRAFITVTADHALERARKLDTRRRGGDGAAELGPLAGVPVAVKDNMCTQGVETTCGSRILKGFVPPYDATAVARLQGAGAIIIGKANMDEFAMGSSTENSAFFPTRNPWDLNRVPGGSSGGSAAAVSAETCALALGSDTGGSIRQPASFCGVVGLKPTYGAVSRYGLVAFASSLDQIGPFARDVMDCLAAFRVIAGYDRRDATSAPDADKLTRISLEPESGVRSLRIGVPKEFFGPGVAPGVRARVEAAIRHLESLGAQVGECSIPSTEYALDAYYIIAPAEASSNLARYDGVRYGHRAEGAESLIDLYRRTRQEGFGPEVKRRIMIGTYVLSAGYYDAYYKKAQQVRTLVVREFQQAFAQFDLLVTPTAPTVAFGLGEKVDDPLSMYLADICTIPINLAGLPALSVPCGLSEGMPVGLQLIGRPFDEATLFQTALAYERSSGLGQQRPPLVAG